MSKKYNIGRVHAIMMVVTLCIGFIACSKDEDEKVETPTTLYNVELSDIEHKGTKMADYFEFDEVEHRQINDNETFYTYYFHDPGARKQGVRNRVVVVWGKVNNFQTSFKYTFNDSKVEVEYEDGEKETLVLKKSVQRALREGDILYINSIPYKRTSLLSN